MASALSPVNGDASEGEEKEEEPLTETRWMGIGNRMVVTHTVSIFLPLCCNERC